MRLGWTTFGGTIPKISPRNLPVTAAQTAQNCWLAEKDLSPIKGPLTETTGATGALSIYLWRRGGTTEWLTWTTDVDVVQGPIADDQYARIYYTDGTTLHMKLWNSTTSTKVEVSDVSLSAPSAPTITKTLLFSPYAINLWWTSTKWTGGVPSVINYMGYSLSGTTITLRYCTNNSNQTILGTDTFKVSYSGGAQVDVPSSTSITLAGGLTMVVTSLEISEDEWNIVVTGQISSPRSDVQYQYYVQTTVNAYGQESPPSAVSAMVEWGVCEQLTINATSSGRLYRSATGDINSNFYFVAENPGSAYVDSTLDASLAETMPLIENPPTAMTGLVSMPGGFLAAFNGKDIYFSEPWLPYSWPTRYRLTVDYDIVGLAVSGNDLIVLTEGNPYYVSGTHPEIMSQTKLPIEQSCVSKRSICFSERFVCYASPDGLCSITGGQVQIVTSQFYTRDQWQALTPSGMLGCVHDARFIGFLSGGGGIIIDFREPGATLSTTDQTATAVNPDLENDVLYLVQGDNITKWRAGTTNLTATWKSKEFQNIQDAIWNSAKVIADSYSSVTFKIFSNGTQVWSYAVTSATAFRVPDFDRSGRWSIQIETTDRVVEVILASSMLLLREMNVIPT